MDISPVNRTVAVSDATATARIAGPAQHSEVPKEQTVQAVKDNSSAALNDRRHEPVVEKKYESGYVSLSDNTIVFQVKDQEEVISQYPDDATLARRRAFEAQEKAREQQALPHNSDIIA